MLNEIKDLIERLQGCRQDLSKMQTMLDVEKNAKSREELLTAQLSTMQAIGKLNSLVARIEKVLAQKEGE